MGGKETKRAREREEKEERKRRIKHMKITTMKDEKMDHNNPAFRNSMATLGMPQEPRDSYLSSNEFMCKSISDFDFIEVFT